MCSSAFFTVLTSFDVGYCFLELPPPSLKLFPKRRPEVERP